MAEPAVSPPPPPGYHPARPFRYPKLILQGVALGLVLALTPALLWLGWQWQGRPADFGLVVALPEMLLMLVVIVGTVLVHEWLHGLAYRLFGYRVQYGASLRLLAAYAGAFGQWQKRDHNLLVGAAPLLVMTPLLLPLLASPNPTLFLIGFTALLFNTAGAVGDFYLLGRLLLAPRATLLYDVDPQHMYLYLPIES